MTPAPHYLTPEQAAARFGITRGHVWRLAAAGLIPGAVQVGKHWNIPSEWRYTPRPVGWVKGRPRKPPG